MYKVLLLLIVFCFLGGSIAASCDSFFHDLPWPEPQGLAGVKTVKLCQTQGSRKRSLYATLFSTDHRIPIYAANVVRLRKNRKIHQRPAGSLWKRVASNLCTGSQPKGTLYSAITTVDSGTLNLCKKWQAVDSDYFKNGLGLDRGHLTPNHINAGDVQKQQATFTLTNAAPQFAGFNRFAWRIYECMIENAIPLLAENERVYILTGVGGEVLNPDGTYLRLKNRVHVPGYFFKAVCYPGNPSKNKLPWGFAVVKTNEPKWETPGTQNFMTLQKFADNHFVDSPFGPECMGAKYGRFKAVFKAWYSIMKANCLKKPYSG